MHPESDHRTYVVGSLSSFSERSDGNRIMSFGKPDIVVVTYQTMVTIDRSRKPEDCLEQDMQGRAERDVFTPRDMRDRLHGIVGNYGDMVRRTNVFSRKDHVSQHIDQGFRGNPATDLPPGPEFDKLESGKHIRAANRLDSSADIQTDCISWFQVVHGSRATCSGVDRGEGRFPGFE